ncbi:MAG: DNA repair protein RecN, partial [Acidothermus sp.]|nr:DNA repair protein RecN [Acidothermus sp.]
AEFGAALVAVHGQAEQVRLRTTAAQREALDSFGDETHQRLLADYRRAYREYQSAAGELEALRTATGERLREADMLRFAIQEIERADVDPEEPGRLASEIERLAHADELAHAVRMAYEALRGTDVGGGRDATTLVASACRALEKAAAHDATLEEYAEQLRGAGYVLEEVAETLASYAAEIDADPARLEAAQERLAVLNALARKYTDGDPARLPGWAAAAARRLTELEDDDQRLAELEAKVVSLRETCGTLAERLSTSRVRLAEDFASAVQKEIHDLAMPHATVTVRVEPTGNLGPSGADEVEFLLAAHRGAPPRPLARGASGGELSRLMLAVEAVLAGRAPVPTFLFDEVDAGIGGKAAVEVGRRLARLAHHAQVIVVTHLPQVAAFADRHLVVVKSDDGSVTRSGVRYVEGKERLAELSRMLAGLEGSALAEGHAAELLATAAQWKEADRSASGSETRRDARRKSTVQARATATIGSDAYRNSS